MEQTVRMTVAQAIVKFLDNQYVSMDGVETKFVEGFFTIFGHGIAVEGDAGKERAGHVPCGHRFRETEQPEEDHPLCFFCRPGRGKHGRGLCDGYGQ